MSEAADRHELTDDAKGLLKWLESSGHFKDVLQVHEEFEAERASPAAAQGGSPSPFGVGGPPGDKSTGPIDGDLSADPPAAGPLDRAGPGRSGGSGEQPVEGYGAGGGPKGSGSAPKFKNVDLRTFSPELLKFFEELAKAVKRNPGNQKLMDVVHQIYLGFARISDILVKEVANCSGDYDNLAKGAKSWQARLSQTVWGSIASDVTDMSGHIQKAGAARKQMVGELPDAWKRTGAFVSIWTHCLEASWEIRDARAAFTNACSKLDLGLKTTGDEADAVQKAVGAIASLCSANFAFVLGLTVAIVGEATSVEIGLKKEIDWGAITLATFIQAIFRFIDISRAFRLAQSEKEAEALLKLGFAQLKPAQMPAALQWLLNTTEAQVRVVIDETCKAAYRESQKPGTTWEQMLHQIKIAALIQLASSTAAPFLGHK